jgi:hypothetical protein
MKVLSFDHFFWQDLDELELAMGTEHELVRISYLRWHQIARKYFPESAFEGVENAYDEKLSSCWTKYRAHVEREVDWVIAAYRPRLFVTPSDAFFYLRPFIEVFKSRGIKTFVMQKETTISPMVMEKHSLVIRQFVPFMSDFMTVCSERHKEFWVKSGANPDLIRVTGQPRFDIYLREREEVDSKAKDNRNLLYLSYDDVAYLPSDLGEAFEGNWKQLREDTERVLREFSKSWNVTVKMHPQQAVGENWLGPNVTIADRLDDTRALIMASDVVIGFQTTSLYEAAVAGKPVIYAAWGSTFENVKESLIRFDLLPEVVTRAESPADLRTLLGEIVNTTPIATRRALKIIEDELGPVDGHATERVLEFMTKYLQDAHPVFLPRIRITPVVSAFVNIGMYGLMRVAAKALAPSRMPQILLRYSIAVQRFREVLRIRNYQKL